MANQEIILLKGELGLEFLEDGTVKIKIGDGKTSWKELKYFADISEIINRLQKMEEKQKTALSSSEILILNCGGAAERDKNGN